MVEEWWSFVKKGDCVWVTHFKHRSVHKYTRVAESRGGVEIKGMIDLVLIKRDMLRYVQGERDGMRPLRPLCSTVQSQAGRNMD